MPTAFSLSGTFNYPPDDGEPIAKRPYSQSGVFDSKQEADLRLVGAGTQSVGFGTLPSVRAMAIEVASTSLGPVTVRINGSLTGIEIAPGGFLVYSNPVPVAGITSMDIDYTIDARVQLRLLG